MRSLTLDQTIRQSSQLSQDQGNQLGFSRPITALQPTEETHDLHSAIAHTYASKHLTMTRHIVLQISRSNDLRIQPMPVLHNRQRTGVDVPSQSCRPASRNREL